MASQTNFFRFVSVFGNYRSLLMNRPAITNSTQIATLKMESREKLRSLPVKPKKPATPFFLFLQEHKAEFQKTFPDLKVTEIAKKLSEKWNQADASVKHKYEEKYKKSMTSYLEKYQVYNSKLTEDQKFTIKEISQERSKDKETRKLKKTLKELNKPKRPKGPFIYFLLEYYEKEKAKGVKFPAFLAKSKTLWEGLSTEEKQKFFDMNLDDKKRYDLEMEHWEAKMIKLGHLNLVRQNTLTYRKMPLREIRRGNKDGSSKPETSNLTKQEETSAKSSHKPIHETKRVQ